MKKRLLFYGYALFLLLVGQLSTHSQQLSEAGDPLVRIMKETGEYQDQLPVMEVLPDHDTLCVSIQQNIRNSFMLRCLELYRLCQCYLVSEGHLHQIEPAYLALTDHQGGYAKQGFILRTPDGSVPKPDAPYVDLTVQAATGDIYGLMSVTQLFPHEMAHVMYRLLSQEDSLHDISRSVDMHYFSVTTDYPTAFNEGFAEHMENAARYYEENDSIRSAIEEDVHRIEKTSIHAIGGFTRDFIYPFRLGFYKASMINWYQKFEDYKRAEYALSGNIKYKNKSLSLRDPEDRLSFRNAGIVGEGSFRNIVQFHATEGAISAFFTALSLSDQKKAGDLDSIFYGICEAGMEDPDPLHIQFLKYFHVLHRYVVRNNSRESQFSDFIRGYLESFPEDREEVLRIYYQLTGQDFVPELPASLWLMVRDHPHRLLVLDPFGAIKAPLYTFNLNAAEADDLLTIRDLSVKEAEAIIDYRNSRGYFESLEDLGDVPGLSPESVEIITGLAFDQAEFETILDGFQPELNLISLLIVPLLRVLFRALLYFLLLFLLILFLLKRRGTLETGKVLRLSLRYLFLWLGMVVLELFILFLFPQSWGAALLPLILVILVALLFYRRRKEDRSFTLALLFLMLLLSIISVV